MDQIKQLALHPEKGHANLTSLAYLEDVILTYWNEAQGDDVEKFWMELLEKSISYYRKDVLKDVLHRKKIKNDQELNTIVDGLVVYQQHGRITSDEALVLSKYISEFEEKHSKKSNQNNL